jgi:glycosyltransferase involved in cell wall biosynthesis
VTAPKVALVHDWFTGMRGGEYVFDAIAEIFPRTDLFTLIYIPGKMTPSITALKRHTSWLQKMPDVERRYRYFLPLMPGAIESFDLSEFDLIVSSSHCVAKGVRKRPDAVHVSYVHAPMRYIWDRFDDYFGPGRSSPLVRAAASAMRGRLQRWDRSVSGKERIDLLIGNSGFIAEQIEKAYGRKARVIHPFADLERFGRARSPGRNYLMVGAFAPYKRLDLAIEAFNRLKLPLLIVGGGQDEARLKKIAGPTVEFLGQLTNDAIADLYSKCKAFVFPGLEDFGITPVEAMAAGAPVIAYGEGGAAETVTDKTGVQFRPQTVEALMAAIEKVESGQVKFDESACRERAGEFSRDKFQRELIAVIREAWMAANRPVEELDARLRLGWAAVCKEI